MRVFYLVPHQRVREQPPEQLIAEHFTLPCSRENSDPSDRNRCLPVTPQGIYGQWRDVQSPGPEWWGPSRPISGRVMELGEALPPVWSRT